MKARFGAHSERAWLLNKVAVWVTKSICCKLRRWRLRTARSLLPKASQKCDRSTTVLSEEE